MSEKDDVNVGDHSREKGSLIKKSFDGSGQATENETRTSKTNTAQVMQPQATDSTQNSNTTPPDDRGVSVGKNSNSPSKEGRHKDSRMDKDLSEKDDDEELPFIDSDSRDSEIKPCDQEQYELKQTKATSSTASEERLDSGNITTEVGTASAEDDAEELPFIDSDSRDSELKPCDQEQYELKQTKATSNTASEERLDSGNITTEVGTASAEESLGKLKVNIQKEESSEPNPDRSPTSVTPQGSFSSTSQHSGEAEERGVQHKAGSVSGPEASEGKNEPCPAVEEEPTVTDKQTDKTEGDSSQSAKEKSDSEKDEHEDSAVSGYAGAQENEKGKVESSQRNVNATDSEKDEHGDSVVSGYAGAQENEKGKVESSQRNVNATDSEKDEHRDSVAPGYAGAQENEKGKVEANARNVNATDLEKDEHGDSVAPGNVNTTDHDEKNSEELEAGACAAVSKGKEKDEAAAAEGPQLSRHLAKISQSWSEHDTQMYRDGYPGKQDYPEQTYNWDFYSGRRVCEPDGLTIDEIHECWWNDYHTLEVLHGYIQWLFPIRESGMNWRAQELQLHEAEKMKADEEVMKRFKKSYEMMLNFYGIRLLNDETGEVERADNWEECFEHLNCSMHNFLRITRILKCLGELGLEHFKAPFLNFVLQEAVVTGWLDRTLTSCYNYWIGTVRDDSQRQALKAHANELCLERERKEEEEEEGHKGNKPFKFLWCAW